MKLKVTFRVSSAARGGGSSGRVVTVDFFSSYLCDTTGTATGSDSGSETDAMPLWLDNTLVQVAQTHDV